MVLSSRSQEDSERWSSTIRLQFFGLSFKDVAQVADELDFYEVEVVKTQTPPAVSPLFNEYAVVLIVLSPIAASFLAELGKDAYKGLKRLLVTAIEKAKSIRDGRGGYTFGVKIDRADSYVMFAFMQPPDGETLTNALQQIPNVLNALPENKHVLVQYDAEHRTWHWEEATPDVEAILKERKTNLRNPIEG